LSTDEYIRFLVVEQKYEKDLRKEGNTEFLDNLKELKEDLGDETTLKNTLEPDSTDTLIDSNPSLKDYADNSSNLDAITKPTLPEIKDFDEEFATYIKFIPDEDLQKRIMENEDIIKLYNKEDDDERMRDEKGEKAYEEYMTAIQTIKETLPTRTQEIIKQRVL